MTTALDRKLPKKVYDTIEKYGVDAVFTVETKTFDRSTRTYNVTSTQDHTRKISPPSENLETMSANSGLSVIRFKCTLAAYQLPFTPEPGMKFRLDGVDYKIENIKTVKSGTLTAAYTLYVV